MNGIITAVALILFGFAVGAVHDTRAQASDALSSDPEASVPQNRVLSEEQTESSPAPSPDSQQSQTSPESPETPYADPAHSQTEPVPGILLSATGDLVAKIVQLREAVRLQPERVQIRLDLGLALYQIGDLDSAIEAYRDAVRRAPDFADARVKLATALMVKHEWAGARDELQAALARQPDLAEALQALGMVRYALGDHAGAIDAYRELLRLRPDYADAHYHLGLVLKLTNHAEPAAYEFLAAAAGGVPHAQYFIGAAYASGLGVERNLVAAIDWWYRAADQNEAQATEALAQLRRMALRKGSPSSAETRAAFAGFRRKLGRQFPDVAPSGLEDSVGIGLLEHGRAQDAVPILIREASALSEPAQNALEVLYERGVEAQIDPYDGRILTCWKALADEGLPRPRLALARVYAFGLGVPRDARKAAGLLKNVPGERAKELLKEISALSSNGSQAARNATTESNQSP